MEVCNEGPCPMRLVFGGVYYGGYIKGGFLKYADGNSAHGKSALRRVGLPPGGHQLRTVYCAQSVSGVSAIVEDSKCEVEVGPKPERRRECERRAEDECPVWFVGEWGGVSGGSTILLSLANLPSSILDVVPQLVRCRLRHPPRRLPFKEEQDSAGLPRLAV